MTAQPDPTDTTDDRREVRDDGMPRWVKVSLIVVAALIVVFVILQLTGLAPGDHGPGIHGPAGPGGG